MSCGTAQSDVRRNPLSAVDVIIEVEGGIVLVRRRNPPLGWALPGGFIEYGETAERAAIREAYEETGLDIIIRTELGVYSNPERDPRFHTLSVVYIADGRGLLRGGDDATVARVFPPEALPDDMVFDHARIVNDYLRFKKTGERPLPGL